MYGDRVLLLKSGKIVCIGSPDQVMTFDTLEDPSTAARFWSTSALGSFPRITLVPQRFKALNSGGGIPE